MEGDEEICSSLWWFFFSVVGGGRLQLPSVIRSIKLVRPLLQYNIDLLLGDMDLLATICVCTLSIRDEAKGRW